MQKTREIQPYQDAKIVNVEDYAMTPDKVIRQVQLIQQVMDKAMKDGEHYGIIPGTNKPTLLKAGAEKLCLTFRFDPDYSIIREVRESDFIAYTVKCDLRHIPTGQAIASGVGSCNSRETKYRWRNNVELTAEAIPKDYWNAKNKGNNAEMKRILGTDPEGRPYVAKKNEQTGTWVKAVVAEKVENDNPWDLDNTLIKMACKRALVAATLNATAASDIFTQDLEDMAENGNLPQAQKPAEKKTKSTKKTASKKEDPLSDDKPNAQHVKFIFELGSQNNLSKEETTQIVEWFRKGDRLTGSEAKALIERMEKDFDGLLDEFMQARAVSEQPEPDDIPL